MASTYTTGFSLEKIGSGEQAGTWGTTSNHNWDIVDRLASYTAIALSDASTATLTVREASPGSGTENLQNGMYRAIKFTGSLSQDCTITIAPNTAPAWFIIENAAGDDIILSQGSGANVTVQNGKNVIVYCDGAGSGAAVVDALADLQIGTLECTGAAAIDGAATFGSTVTVGVDDTGYDVKFFGATSGRYWLWDESADGVVQLGTLTVGVDDTGHDVKFFGATSGAYMLWDESADDLKLVGAAGLTVAGDIDVDGTTNLDAVDIDGATQIDGTITVGVDDTGYDVKFFGATSGAYMLWDESADDLKLVGAAGLTVAGDIDVDGTTNLDAVDVDGAVNFAADVTFADGADIITASAGTSNFRAGVNAGNSIESGGNYNVAVGDEAGTALTTGDNNVVVGYAAGDAITTGGSNVAVGTSALSAVTDQSENVAVGNSAMAGATSASGNVAVGDNAGGGATNTADNNVWIGNNAGYATTSGASNVLIGYAAGDAITTGGSNVGVGYNALTTNTTSAENVAVGTSALATQNGGSANVAIGHNALTALTTAGENAACGYAAGTAITTGASNSFFGLYAGYAATTSSYHVLIGRGAGSNITTSHSCIMIGYGSQASAATGVSDELVIGKSMTGKGSNTGFISPNNGAVYQGNNSTAWTQTSDRRIKKNIFDNDIGLEKINQIQVRNFEYRTPDEIDELPEHAAIDKKGLQIGVVAQEIQTVLPDIVEEESTGCLSVNPDNMTWYLVNAVKELSAQVDELKAEIHALKGE